MHPTLIKMEDKKAGVVINEFVGLNKKMYLLLIDYSREHKKAKGMNKNAVLLKQ